MFVTAVLLLLLLVYPVGAAASRHLCRRGLRVHEALWLHALLGFLICGLVMMALYFRGAFSLPRLALAQGLIFAALAYPLRREWRAALEALWRFRPGREAWGFLAVSVPALALTLTLYQRPSEWVLSYGMDAANYVVQAAYYTGSDSIFLKDAQQDAYREFFPKARYKLNSTTHYPVVAAGGRELAFPPLWKMMLTLFALCGGTRFSLYAALPFGLLTALGVGALFRRLTGSRFHGLLAGAGLLFCPLFFHYLRLPMSEVFMLYLATGALLLLLLAQEEGAPRLALVGGLVFGCLPLVRADAVLLYGGVVLGAGYGVFVVRQPEQRASLLLFAGAVLLATPLAWYGSLYATHFYLGGVMGGDTSQAISALLPATAVAGIALAYLWQSRPRSMAWLQRLDTPWLFRALAVALALYFLAILLLAFVLPPAWKDGLAAAAQVLGLKLEVRGVFQRGLVRYMTPVVVLLGMAGCVIALYGRNPRQVFYLAVFSMGALLYLYHAHHSTSPYWFIRRYLYTVLPFLLGGLVFLLAALERRFSGKIAVRYLRGGTLVLVGAAYLTYGVAHGYGRIDLSGALNSLEHFAGRFGTRDVVIVDGAMPKADALQLGLRYLEKREALAPLLDSVTDAELLAFFRHAREGQQGVFVVYTKSKTGRRVKALFETEEQQAAIAYDNLKKGKRKGKAHRMTVLRLLASREKDANRATPAPPPPASAP